MKSTKKIWLIIGLVIFMIISRVNYYNKFQKVDDRVIRGVVYYTTLIENSRINDPVYELREMLEVEEMIGAIIPVNEKSRKDVDMILLMKDLNDILYLTHYYRDHKNIEEEFKCKEEYKECLEAIRNILTPYRGKVKEVDKLWSEGIFEDYSNEK